MAVVNDARREREIPDPESPEVGPEPWGPWERAELEIERVRDLLGVDSPRPDPQLRALARLHNRLDHDDAAAPRLAALASRGGADGASPGAGADAAAREPLPEPAPPGRSRSAARTPTRWAGSLAAAACLAVGIMVVTTALPVAPAMATPPMLDYRVAVQHAATAPDAADLLVRLSEAAGASPVPGAGDVGYVAATGWNASMEDAGARIVPFDQEVWRAPDGSGLLERTVSRVIDPEGRLVPRDADGAAPGESPGESATRYPVGALRALPVDGGEDAPTIAERLLTGARPDCAEAALVATCLVEEIANLAGSHVIPGEVMAALWASVGDGAGLHDLGVMHDRAGRRAVAIVGEPRHLDSETIAVVVLADATTGRVLGSEQITIEAPFVTDRPVVTAFTSVNDSRWVGRVGERPGS